jgi:hypothetical protein
LKRTELTKHVLLHGDDDDDDGNDDDVIHYPYPPTSQRVLLTVADSLSNIGVNADVSICKTTAKYSTVILTH